MKIKSLIALLNLLNTKGLGPQRVRLIVSRFKDPMMAFEASKSELCSVEGVDLKTATAIHGYNQFEFGQQELDRASKIGVQLLTFWDVNYPFLLKKIYDPPVILYVKGKPLDKKEDCVAVVGTRDITAYGKKATSKIVKELVSSGIRITSGLARGVDSLAHKETVKQGGRAIAVLGNGIDFVYPRENRKLAGEICEKGTIISEFPLGTNPDAGNFPQRNRIISGLSHGTIVVEAGTRSGAILTALNSVDQNREVFAVPGRITDKMSIGCNRLIRNGAISVDSGDRVLEHIQSQLFKPRSVHQEVINLDLSNEERALVSLLDDHPLHIDEIVKAAELEVTQALTILLKLELKGAIVQHSGKQFSRA